MESGFVRVARTSDIVFGKMKKVDLGDLAVLIVNFNGVYFAVDSLCTHYGGDLSEDTQENGIITCPVQSKVRCHNGKVISPPIEPLDHPDIEDLQHIS